jgi:hypothetical protein
MFFKSFLLGLLMATCGICHAQEFRADLMVTGRNAYISALHLTKYDITVFLDRKGNIVGACEHDQFIRDAYQQIAANQGFDDNLQLEFYGKWDDNQLLGKLKKIGNLPITYYDRFDWDELRGKVKSIGDVKLTYYDRFDWDELKGKLKSVGDLKMVYYDRFGWDEVKGKLKQAGNTTITYYDRFDADSERGRVKNVREKPIF